MIALLIWAVGWLEIWEAKTWDWRVLFLARPGKATEDIRLILLDQKSLDWAAEEWGLPWPWPREVYAHLVNYCRRNKVKVLAFDVLFTEFSQYGVEDDTALGNALAEFPFFVAPLFLGDTTGASQWPADFPTPRLSITGLEEWLIQTNTKDLVLPRALLPISEIGQNAGLLCNVQHTPDADGVFRRIKLFNVFDQKIFPTLGLGTYLVLHPQALLQINAGRLTVDDHQIPIDQHGNVILQYRRPERTHPSYSVAEMLLAESRVLARESPTERKYDLQRSSGKICSFRFFRARIKRFASCTGWWDLFRSREINATLLDNLLSDDFMARFPLWLNIIVVLSFAMICTLLTTFYSSPLQNVALGAIALIVPVLCSLCLYRLNFWLPLISGISANSHDRLFPCE